MPLTYTTRCTQVVENIWKQINNVKIYRKCWAVFIFVCIKSIVLILGQQIRSNLQAAIAYRYWI